MPKMSLRRDKHSGLIPSPQTQPAEAQKTKAEELPA